MALSNDAKEALALVLRELTSTTPTLTSSVAPTTPGIPLSVIPSPAPAPSPPIPAQYISTRFSDLKGNPVSGSRLTYTKQYKEAEATRKAAKEANKEITMIVIFYLQEKPGETNPIPDTSISVNLRPKQIILNIDSFARDYFVTGLPSIVDFRPEWTDKFYFTKEMQYIKGKYYPRWISGVDETFDGTIKELINKLPGRKAKLHVVVKRYQDTYSFEADLWDDEAPFHMTTPCPAPPEAATLVGAQSVAEPVRAEPVRRKRARSPVTTPRRSQRRRRVR
ncbi:hypothetical protein N7524_004121 [Penicillium chrysogenum]|nr:hypothetical protein N7524_004121 [Penicillium chrysogenum]